MLFAPVISASFDVMNEALIQMKDLDITFEFGEVYEEPDGLAQEFIDKVEGLECLDQPLVSIDVANGTCTFRNLNEECEAQAKEVYILSEEKLKFTNPQTDFVSEVVEHVQDLPAIFGVDGDGLISQLNLVSTMLVSPPRGHTDEVEYSEDGSIPFITDLIGEFGEAQLYLVEHETPHGDMIKSLFSRYRAPEAKMFVVDFHGAEKAAKKAMAA